MRRESIDTNVLLRLLLKDIPEQHAKAKALIGQPGIIFMVSDTAMVELVFVLERHYCIGRHHIVEMVKALMGLGKLEISRTVLRGALETYEKSPRLSYEDCYLAQRAAASGSTPLWTFDEKLARRSEHAELLV
ncbi:MAG: PIN domain-containing protein [Coriobacteriia bacterium]|nr:PIN domain-containing protein [Coriobacteriia bacterium]